MLYFSLLQKKKKKKKKTSTKKKKKKKKIHRKNVFLLPLQKKKSCDRTEMYFSIFVYFVKVEKTQD